jgi:putative membrane protein
MTSGATGRFAVRWFVCGLGLWLTAAVFGVITYDGRIGVIIVAGLILAVVNTVLKPIVVILSLPAILFSLGLFMIIINGLMVWLVSWLYPDLYVASFISAMLAGMVIGLVNYLTTAILDRVR